MPSLDSIPIGHKMANKIQQLYLVAVFFWTFLILFLRIQKNADAITILLVGIPYLVFFLNFQNAQNISPAVEKHVNQGVATFLSFGFMVVIILINWNEANKDKSTKGPYFRIIAAALVLMALSLIDIWPEEKNLTLVSQARSTFRTMSLVLFILAFYKYYTRPSETQS